MIGRKKSGNQNHMFSLVLQILSRDCTLWLEQPLTISDTGYGALFSIRITYNTVAPVKFDTTRAEYNRQAEPAAMPGKDGE